MKKEAYYFSHDSNARNDLKMVKLRRSLGLEGYGIFWCIIEILRETEGYILEQITISDIAFELKADQEKVKSVVNDFGLFKKKGSKFYSARLSYSMQLYNEKKDKLSDAGKRGNAIRWQSGGDGQVIAIKGNKEKKKGDFSPDGVFKSKDRTIRNEKGEIQYDHNGHPLKSLEGMVF